MASLVLGPAAEWPWLLSVLCLCKSGCRVSEAQAVEVSVGSRAGTPAALLDSVCDLPV